MAIVHLRRAVELVPTHDIAHLELGAALWHRGDVEGGVAECEIAVCPKRDWKLRKLGYAQRMRICAQRLRSLPPDLDRILTCQIESVRSTILEMRLRWLFAMRGKHLSSAS